MVCTYGRQARNYVMYLQSCDENSFIDLTFIIKEYLYNTESTFNCKITKKYFFVNNFMEYKIQIKMQF